jgi:DNA ligase (NAD+)
MNVEEIQKNPLIFLEKAKKKEIIDLLKRADEAFFNTGNTILTDDIYDIIKDHVRDKYPKDPYLKRVGADEVHKVKLPYYMGSQNKIRDDEGEIQKFQDKYKGPYVISDKLDGISCLVMYTKNGVKIYTRGNGTEGQDISHIIEYVKGIPSSTEGDIAIRGELIISRKNWEKLREYGANARNVVAGAINSKIINKAIMNNIEFVAYSLLHPKMELSTGLALAKSNKFKVVRHVIVNSLNLELLSKYLVDWRKSAEFEIDGIVVSDIAIYNITKGKNPDYSFAFKSIHTHEQVEVIVTGVEWNVSKDKYIKPIVKFNEIDLDGVKIKQATGFNAAYIEKNVIGAGSRIIIIRSGGVIPHIHSVLTPSANGKPSFPEKMKYRWNDTHIDIILEDEKNRDHDIQEIIYFMKTLEIENMGPGNITKIYEAGFDTLKKFINIMVQELLKIDGFKEKSANKIFDSLQKIRSVECLKLIDASNTIGRGFGTKKIKLISDMYPFILKQDDKNRKQTLNLKVEDLVKIQGISDITARAFLDNIKHFHTFYDELGIKCIAPIQEDKQVRAQNSDKSDKSNMIANKSFVFTGFRNKELEKFIEGHGGSVKTSVSKNTDYLLVADANDQSAKVLKARELGIQIVAQNDEMWKKLFPKTI